MAGKGSQKKLSRRDFLKGAAMGTGVIAVGFSPGKAAAKTDLPERWHIDADVVIVGFGGAGACAAIEAHDAGAKVLLLEKQPKETHYPNTRMSGGIFHSPDPTGDKNALKEYALAMFSGDNLPWKLEGEQPHDIAMGLAEAWAEYTPGNLDFLKKVDPEFKTVPMSGFSGAAFPQFPGAKESKYRVFGSTFTVRASLDTPSKDLPKSEKMNGEAFFAVLRGGVERRGIPVSYSTPAKGLVMSKDGEIIGVVAEQGGKDIAAKAKKAVIITSGGYEYNPAMRRAFLEGPGIKGWAFYGSPDNTGDGIAMAMGVGAGLAKVGKAASRIITAVPIERHGLKMGLITDSVGSPNSIVVDDYGNRYDAETLVTTDPSRYFFYKEAVKFDIVKLVYPRDPSWMVFDENFRTKRCVTSLGISTAGFGFVPWTKDNLDAINRGWILKGDTIEEIAAKIKDHPDNRKLMVPENLVKTVARFNEFCAKGKDEEFNRLPVTLGPVEKPPYYALPLYPGGPNTKGGIQANAKREVLTWEGKPIPRLFSAGEISSALKFVYQGGGNLTECIVFGRIAGKNAAALKPWE